MQIGLRAIIGASALLISIAGCHQASSPATVDNNVASAREDAARNDVKVIQDQVKTDAAANADAADALQKAEIRRADSAYDVVVTEAEGRQKIALQKCDALAGDSQKACKDQADAALALTKANAKAARAALN
jgi:hypothetical protein